jgi:hypothetical protein
MLSIVYLIFMQEIGRVLRRLKARDDVGCYRFRVALNEE